MGSLFGSGNAPKVKAAAPKKVNISAGVAVGMLIQKTMPIYPPIAKAARVSGHRGTAGDHLQAGNHRRSARRQRTGHVAAGGDGCGQDMALQALPAQQRAGGSGDHGQRDLHPGWMRNISGSLPALAGSIAFTSNANFRKSRIPSNSTSRRVGQCSPQESP